MWTRTTRRLHSRVGFRHETDLADAERAVVEPLLPEPALRGRPTLWPMREILNGIFYVLRGGIAWRLLPKDSPPKSTVFGYFSRLRDAGVVLRINHQFVMADRERVGGDALPRAAVLDSQSVTTPESGGSRGYDAGQARNPPRAREARRGRHCAPELRATAAISRSDTQKEDHASNIVRNALVGAVALATLGLTVASASAQPYGGWHHGWHRGPGPGGWHHRPWGWHRPHGPWGWHHRHWHRY